MSRRFLAARKTVNRDHNAPRILRDLPDAGNNASALFCYRKSIHLFFLLAVTSYSCRRLLHRGQALCADHTLCGNAFTPVAPAIKI